MFGVGCRSISIEVGCFQNLEHVPGGVRVGLFTSKRRRRFAKQRL